MDISTIANFIKLPRKAIFLVSVITTTVLFSDQQFLEKIALYDFKEEFKAWIGVCFLFSSGLSIIHISEYAWQAFKHSRKEKQTFLEAQRKLEKEKFEKAESEAKRKAELEEKKRVYRRGLERLDKYELANIREFYIQEQNTIKMSLEDPVVIGLVTKRIICQVGNKGYRSDIAGHITFFCIDSRAIEYFDSYDFGIIENIDRPSWINGLANQAAINAQLAELGKQMLGS